MRAKHACIVYTFDTTAAAMAMEKFCHAHSLPGRLIPAPRSITADCGISWCIRAEEREAFESAAGLPEYSAVYEREL